MTTAHPVPPEEGHGDNNGYQQHSGIQLPSVHCQDYNPHESPATTARRYRNSSYFMADQLRTSEALNDFRLTKTVVQNMPQFSLRHQLDFAIRTANLTD